jgi:hypothetical protein
MQKDFDCVEMKRKGQESLRRKLAGKTPSQVLQYWAKRTQELRDRQREAICRQAKMDQAIKSA